MTPWKVGKKVSSVILILIRIVLYLHFIGVVLFLKNIITSFYGVIWIIATLMKMNVSMQKPKSSRGDRHARKLRLRTDAWRDERCTHALNTQLPRVIAERVIHLSSYNWWLEFWPEPMKFLVDMLNHAHWLRILVVMTLMLLWKCHKHVPSSLLRQFPYHSKPEMVTRHLEVISYTAHSPHYHDLSLLGNLLETPILKIVKKKVYFNKFTIRTVVIASILMIFLKCLRFFHQNFSHLWSLFLFCLFCLFFLGGKGFLAVLANHHVGHIHCTFPYAEKRVNSVIMIF